MRRWIVGAGLLALGCAASEPEGQASRQAKEDPVAQTPPHALDEVSAANLGKRITLEGRAVNRKGGATLVGEGFEVWMADFDSWPSGYYEMGGEGKPLRVTGVLGEDHGLPVFVPREDEPIVQGIPVPEGTDLEAASHRYMLKDAKWEPR